MGGVIAATLLAVFFVPIFFVVVRRLFPGGHVVRHGTSISSAATDAAAAEILGRGKEAS
jgi:multidrug efflux pump